MNESVEFNETYRNIDITIRFSSIPIHEHTHRDKDINSKSIAIFMAPEIYFKSKDTNLRIDKMHFHLVRTLDGRYFTHSLPYEYFESPQNLSYALVDMVLEK